MHKKLTGKRKKEILPISDLPALPDWGTFRPETALRKLRKLYKEEREIIAMLYDQHATVSDIFATRAPHRRAIIQLLGALFHLERVAKSEYPGISKTVQTALVLVEEHSQYLSLYSKYPEMIRRLSRSSLSGLSRENQWYFSREIKEFISGHPARGNALRRLSALRSELDALERAYSAQEAPGDDTIIRMIGLRAELAQASGFSSWNEQALEGLTMSSVGVKGISSLLLRSKEKVADWQLQKFEEYRGAFSAPRYTEHGALEAIKEILRLHFGMTVHPRSASVWAKGVLFFEVHNEAGALLGGLYLDLWSRKGKIEGAWSGAIRDGEKDILPLTMVVTGFSPGKKISHYEFVTLIHELGHAVHYILSRPDSYLGYVRYLEDDAVEVAGRFFERFSFEEHIVQKALCGTKKTFTKRDQLFLEKLPGYKRAYLVRDRSFDVSLSLFDWTIHLLPPKDSGDLHARWEHIRDQVIPDVKAKESTFPPSFRYVFGGSHSAKFLIYIWADIIAGQLYQKYNSKRKVSPRKAQDLLRGIFQKGSSTPMMEALRPLFGSRVSMNAYTDEVVAK